MTTHNQTSNPSTRGKFGDLLFARQTPMLHAKTHKSLVASLAGQFNAWRERRHAAAELASLSDRELADIGVTRQDIPNVISGKR